MDYRIATVHDAEEIISLLAGSFSESEPPAVAMGLSFSDMEQFLRIIIPVIVPQELTLVARDPASATVAGVMLNEDFACAPHVDLKEISSKFLPIFSMLASLDRQFLEGKRVVKGEYLHMFMLAVAPAFAGMGIAQVLVKASLENVCQNRYRTAFTEATGEISQHVFRKCGFIERHRVRYQDFAFEGRRAFASIQQHEAALLLERSRVGDR